MPLSWIVPPPATGIRGPALLRAGASLLRPSLARRAVADLESRLARRLGAAEAVLVPSVRLAFLVLFKAAGVDIGARVLIPALGSTGAAAAAVALGGRLVFVDARPGHFLPDPEHAADRLRGRGAAARVVVLSHPLGYVADAAAFRELADGCGALLLEDCGSSYGAAGPEGPVGLVGEAAVFSCGLRSPVTTAGGAVVVGRNRDWLARLRAEVDALAPNSRVGVASRLVSAAVASHGPLSAAALAVGAGREGLPGGRLWTAIRENLLDEVVDLWGERTLKRRSCRPHAALASVALSQLDHLDADLDARRAAWGRLRDALAGQPSGPLPPAADTSPAYVGAPLLVDDPGSAAARLHRAGIVAWDQPMLNAAQLPLFQPFREELPNASRTASSLLQLPLMLGATAALARRTAAALAG